MRVIAVKIGNLVFVVVLILVGWEYWEQPRNSNSDWPGKDEQFQSDLKPDAELLESFWDPDATSIDRHLGIQLWSRRGAEAVPALLEALERRHPCGRKYIVQALAAMGAEAHGAVLTLQALLQDPEAEIRRVSVDALDQIGDHDATVISDLALMLCDEDASVRDSASVALVGIGIRAVPDVSRLVDHEAAFVRWHVVETLRSLAAADDAGQAVEVVRTVIRDPDNRVRAAVYRCLAEWQQLTLADCRRGLHDSQEEVIRLSLADLADMNEDALPAAEDLIELLQRTNAEIESTQVDDRRRSRRVRDRRNRIFNTLARIGPHPQTQPAVPLLLEVMDQEPNSIELNSPGWLIRICTDRQLVIDRLTTGLKNGMDWQIAAYGECLRQYAPDVAGEQVPRLLEQLEKGDPQARLRALYAVQGLGPLVSQAVPAIVAELKSGNMATQPAALAALAAIGPAAQPAVPTLVEILESVPAKNWSVAQHVVRTIGQIGPAAVEAVPELTRQLKLQIARGKLVPVGLSAGLSMEIVVTLGKIGPAGGEQCLPVLRRMAFERRSSPDSLQLRPAIFDALAKIAADDDRFCRDVAEELIAKLAESRRSSQSARMSTNARARMLSASLVYSVFDRGLYVRTLGEFESLPEVIVPVLVDVLDSDVDAVRILAADAVARFGSQAERAIPSLQALRDADGSDVPVPPIMLEHGPNSSDAWDTELADYYEHAAQRRPNRSLREAAETALQVIEPAPR